MSRGKINYSKYGYIFCIPFVVAYLIFSLYPTLYTAVIGFTDLQGVGHKALHLPKGGFFGNYLTILQTPTFIKALKNTVIIWLCNFVPQMIIALVLAAWFTDRRLKVPGAGAFKVLFYMPNIITAATVAILFNALFGYPMGPLNDILTSLHITTKPVEFLQSKIWAKGIVIFIQTWMWYGYTMIIMISGILGISPDIFEAAEIDGASGWQVFWKITLPSIKTILLFTLVTSLIGGLNMFDIPYLFLNGGPDNATITTSVFIYKQAFTGKYLYNTASAASMIMFIIIVIISAFMFFMLRDKDEAKLKKEMKLRMKEEKLRIKAEKSAKLAAMAK